MSPLARVGICVPGGAAAYPSTVLMTAVPAQAAGVSEIAVVAPPTKFGANNPDVLATCHELGVTRGLSRRRGAGGGGAGVWRRRDCARSIRSSGRAICSWRWPSGMCMARSISIRSPGRAKWSSLPMTSTRPDFTAADLLAQAEHAAGGEHSGHLERGDCWKRRPRELERQVAGLSRCEVTIQIAARFRLLDSGAR